MKLKKALVKCEQKMHSSNKKYIIILFLEKEGKKERKDKKQERKKEKGHRKGKMTPVHHSTLEQVNSCVPFKSWRIDP